ncbi:MAG: LysR family transcriptional regulator [Treponemataceae bacterium]|nr:LysR family transcriptional regulator [Treponemataceae bacterium]
MDLELLQFRAKSIQKVRDFFITRNYLELDTPALSPTLIPETCLEVFTTNYLEPWTNKEKPVYMVPSPEVFIKKIISQHKVSVFQLSKCYRNVESVGRTHSPEFTMLEYYTMDADYKDSLTLTEELFNVLLPPLPNDGSPDPFEDIRPPFIRLTMDDAFAEYAGFRLSDCPKPIQLAEHARRLGITELPDSPFDQWPWDDLYELILVQCIEPALPKEKPVFLLDYPAKVPCLAQNVPPAKGEKEPLWKERWELYARGIELANCYSEETDPLNVRKYFEEEGNLKKQNALIPHAIDEDYWKTFQNFPKCSGVAMGVDRLIMVLAGKRSIESVLPFPFRLKSGYY